MAVKRYTAIADTTITNAYGNGLTETTRATGSNMGAADTLEIFSIYGQASGTAEGFSQELSRALLKFPVTTISSDRTAGTIPASGSVRFYLRIFNAEHAFTLPRDYTLSIMAVSQSWEEGSGADVDEYKDKTYDGIGTNWVRRSSTATWNSTGGDFHSGSYTVASSFPKYTVDFSDGTEDIDLDVTAMVEEWIGAQPHASNNGLGVFLSASYEGYFSASQYPTLTTSSVHNVQGATRSYYTKKFFARSSEFFFRKPHVEARWDSSTKDDRGNFYFSSSLASQYENLNTLYLYNYVRGGLRNIPGVDTSKIYVSVYSGSSPDNTMPSSTPLALPVGGGVATAGHFNVTGGWTSTGIYTASFAVTASSKTDPITKLFDVWHRADGGAGGVGATQYHTGTIYPKSFEASNVAPTQTYVTKITNLKSLYSTEEIARFRLFVRQKNWKPNIYSVATTNISNLTIESGSYKIFRVTDELDVVPYGTGSFTRHTHMSHDVSGSYFDLDISMLQPDYAYGIKLSYYNDSIGSWVEQPETFKFRVE